MEDHLWQQMLRWDDGANTWARIKSPMAAPMVPRVAVHGLAIGGRRVSIAIAECPPVAEARERRMWHATFLPVPLCTPLYTAGSELLLLMFAYEEPPGTDGTVRLDVDLDDGTSAVVLPPMHQLMHLSRSLWPAIQGAIEALDAWTVVGTYCDTQNNIGAGADSAAAVATAGPFEEVPADNALLDRPLLTQGQPQMATNAMATYSSSGRTKKKRRGGSSSVVTTATGSKRGAGSLLGREEDDARTATVTEDGEEFEDARTATDVWGDADTVDGERGRHRDDEDDDSGDDDDDDSDDDDLHDDDDIHDDDDDGDDDDDVEDDDDDDGDDINDDDVDGGGRGEDDEDGEEDDGEGEDDDEEGDGDDDDGDDDDDDDDELTMHYEIMHE
jgi:hypothetical protein